MDHSDCANCSNHGSCDLEKEINRAMNMLQTVGVVGLVQDLRTRIPQSAPQTEVDAKVGTKLYESYRAALIASERVFGRGSIRALNAAFLKDAAEHEENFLKAAMAVTFRETTDSMLASLQSAGAIVAADYFQNAALRRVPGTTHEEWEVGETTSAGHIEHITPVTFH